MPPVSLGGPTPQPQACIARSIDHEDELALHAVWRMRLELQSLRTSDNIHVLKIVIRDTRTEYQLSRSLLSGRHSQQRSTRSSRRSAYSSIVVVV